MGTRSHTTTDPDLIEAVARGQVEALHELWERYSGAVHWVCAVYEPDARTAYGHLVATFLALWTNPLADLRARSVPEQLTAFARSACRTTRPEASDSRATRQRIDRLDDVQLTSVALLFSGEFRVDDAIDILGCSQSVLGHSLRTLLVSDARRRGRQLSR
jgi:hypothetical protein